MARNDSGTDKPLTVRRLKEIMNEIPDDMITDALVLVYCKGRQTEYAIMRTGQFRVVPNLTFDLVPNRFGLAYEDAELQPPTDEPRKVL